MFIHYTWKNQEVDYENGTVQMHYQQTTDASLCCQIFPGILQAENNAKIDIMKESFWSQKNPWQIIFDGYKTGMRPGKQGVQVRSYLEGATYTFLWW